MAAKTFLVVFALVPVIKSISCQCINSRNAAVGGIELSNAGLFGNGLGYGVGLAGDGLASGYGLGLAVNGLAAPGVAASNGGGFSVTSSSPIAPTGVSVVSDYAIEGPLSVAGQLPLLGSVGLEGQLGAGGQAAISYGCGNGNIGIVSEGIGAGLGAPIGLGPAGLGVAGLGSAGRSLGYSNGLGARGIGCGGIY